MSTHRLALLTAFALLLAAAPATAAPARGLTVNDAQRIAAVAFPGTCGPTLTITFAVYADTHGRATGRQRIDGTWQTVDCSIEVRPGLSPERTCDVIVHERGHLAGIDEHTATGIMSADGALNAGGWPPCHRPRRRKASPRLRPGSRFDA